MLKYINKKNKYLYFIIAFLLLVILSTIIFIFYADRQNITVQEYLHEIHEKIKTDTYNNIINKNYDIKIKDNIIILDDFLNPQYFAFIRNQFENKSYESKNVLVRKGTGINFIDLHKEKYDGLLELYYSDELTKNISNVVGKPVQRTPLSDPNSCSLLIYNKKDDYINWHYDYSLYYGDRYVLLLTIINENASKNGLSENVFKYKHNNEIKELKMRENSLIIFKGSEIEHMSTGINTDEKRILLSMVFCDICQEKKNMFNIIYEKLKNNTIYK
jgi:hypothetical protein